MNFLVSGQGGLAVLINRELFRTLSLDGGETEERRMEDLPMILDGLSDVREFSCDSNEQALAELELAWQRDRAVHLSLILLDNTEEDDTRIGAVECLSEFFQTESVREYVDNRLYAAPLPAEGDLLGATRLATTHHAPGVLSFLEQLASAQGDIATRVAAWRNLPDTLFGTESERESFRLRAIDAGAFRLFVREQGRNDRALFQLLVHPAFKGSARARQVLQAWAAPFKEALTNSNFMPDDDDIQPMSDGSRHQGRLLSARDALARVQKQKIAIKQLLKDGNRDRALGYAKELAEFQRVGSERTHLAMSLCDLASFAKQLGDPALQLEFSTWATMEAPDDAWSFGQVGDAYRALGHYDKALDAFARAGNLGDVRTALLGRAEVLKDNGEINEALAIYDKCVALFPGDVVAQNGRAAALCGFGRFQESLELYDALCMLVPADPVSWTGRAEVHRETGRLDDALGALDEIVMMFPDEVVPKCAQGEVLRELGRFDEALSVFQKASEHFSLCLAARIGAARVLRDQGWLDAAMQAFQQVTRDFPLDAAAFVGIADVQRRRGALTAALAAYRDAKERFPKSGPVRTGMAAVLGALGQYHEAESLLPAYLPASLREWIGYYVLGTIRMRVGNLESASSIFEHGLAECPWAAERSYFRTALAALRVRSAEFSQALVILQVPAVASLEPIASLIQLHARAALGQDVQLDAAQRQATGVDAPPISHLRKVLLSRVRRSLINRHAPFDAALFQLECDAFLLAA